MVWLRAVPEEKEARPMGVRGLGSRVGTHARGPDALAHNGIGTILRTAAAEPRLAVSIWGVLERIEG